MSRWNLWVDIEKNASYKGCGVYKIRLTDSKDYPIEIPRFLDKDKDGILQIGSSKDTERRIKSFRGAIKGEPDNNQPFGLLLKGFFIEFFKKEGFLI